MFMAKYGAGRPHVIHLLLFIAARRKSMAALRWHLLRSAARNWHGKALSQQRLMSNASASSGLNLSSARINDNVIYSRHEDCNLHNMTIVQRFFEQTKLFPKATAMVSPFLLPHGNLI